MLRSSSMYKPRGPPLEVVNDNFTRHKLDAKRTTTSQPKKIEGARWRQRGSAALARLTGRARRASDGARTTAGNPLLSLVPEPGTRGAKRCTRVSEKNEVQNSNDPSAGSPTETLLRLLLLSHTMADPPFLTAGALRPGSSKCLQFYYPSVYQVHLAVPPKLPSLFSLFPTIYLYFSKHYRNCISFTHMDWY